MPSSKSTTDKKASISSRRLSLTRRASSESTKSPTNTTTPPLPSPRHGLVPVHPTAANAQTAAMPAPGLQQKHVDGTSPSASPSMLPESPSAVLNAAFASPTSSHGLPSPAPPGDSVRSMDDIAGRTAGGDVESPPSTLTESQIQLNLYRERLARDLERRDLASRGLLANSADKARVSPIQEESVTSPPSAPSSGPTTATSTESGNTIRGGYTPGLMAGTPSYPFPRMAITPGFAPGYMQRPFNTMSPSSYNFMSHAMSLDHFAAQDKVLSGSSTPASALTFHPSGSAPYIEGSEFPTPNLYDLSLMLSAEPGLDAWWSTVVQIMRDVYKAERITLAVPADSTDIENVPWGQKATYNEHEEDELSLAYLARSNSMVPSSMGDFSGESPVTDEAQRLRPTSRPSLQTRHSFTAYEEDKASRAPTGEPVLSKRPSFLARSKSYFPPGQPPADMKRGNPELNKTSLARHDAQDEDRDKVPSWEAPLAPPPLGKGRVLPMLQALDYEADPLIDHTGVTRVLDRGKVIALTRSYPYLQNQPQEPQSKSKSDSTSPDQTSKKRPKKPRGDSSAKLSTLLSNANAPRTGKGAPSAHSEKWKPSSMISRLEQEQPPQLPPQYEEYEQAPPSPWSQSPAPSPAVRPEPKENPFFADATVDEDSFNPDSGPATYAGMPPPEAIGVDNSWTVLHIPLTHLLLSKPTSTHPFRLDASALEQKTAQVRESRAGSVDARVRSPSPEDAPRNDKPHPIAILSILSPIIPYPSSLRHSLEHLGPHLATSFSIARHYSNLETELAGMQRRRPQTAGFGGLATDGRPLADPTSMAAFSYGMPEELINQSSLTGSITSPSDYSGLSKSAAGSPSGTPGWDQGTLSLIMDRRQGVSPAQMSSSGDSYFSTKQRLSATATDSSSASGSHKHRGNSKETSPADRKPSRKAGVDPDTGERSDDGPLKRASSRELKVPRDDDTAGKGRGSEPRTPDHQHKHTQLHSYGADFATSFQSLPPSSSVVSKPAPHTAPSRGGSLQMGPADMPPPSDRLKGLMLDALPAHVFVSLPQTGEVVWVNSRYLTYRGQTVADLAANPWGSIHPEDRDEYLKAWSHSLRTGEQFSRTVRIKRFDGVYRWFYARAVASRDKRGVLMQFLGSYMDIHDQHIAELKAARQEEIEASEAKHRLLANLIPQIIFTATEDEGITFANDQWLSYTGQSFEDCLGLGFMDFVHPEDLAKCKIPTDRPPTPLPKSPVDRKTAKKAGPAAPSPSNPPKTVRGQLSEANIRGVHQALSRNNSSSSGSVYELPTTDLSELARKGIIKVATDSNGRLSYTTEVRLRSKAGEYRWHLIRCVEIDNIDFGSGASSFFGSATDINDHKLLEAKLKEAMESKSRFLSNMSHEIRTPLIGISGMVSFLQDTILNEEQRDYTNTIQTSANSLLMIINDILDLSKVDAGMMKLKYEWFHTRALIEDVNELVSTMAIAKRLELNYVVDADVPTWVKGDKVRIRQVLLNVIGNAIKFTSEGEVFSRCRIFTGDSSAVEANEISLEFAIIDTGRGFSKEEAELIFKPFSQIDGSSTRQHGGSGLGLVISRQLVELHGGKMEGTAVPGKGSTFTFTARFTLPTPDDHPDLPISPMTMPMHTDSQHNIHLPPPGYKPLPPNKPLRLTPKSSPATEPGVSSLASSGSSDPSIHSGRSQITERSSVSSVNVGLVHFSEAARASGQDLSQMKLELPPSETSSNSTPTHDSTKTLTPPQEFRPPMYSILIICPQTHSREATAQHIEQVLPKDVPHQITALESVEQADELIGGDDPVHFSHIVLNLPSPESLMSMLDRVQHFTTTDRTAILILSDTGQRQAVVKLATDAKQEPLVSEERVTFINKPVKPSRFAVIFDPEKMQDSSIDRNRSTAQRMVESQKQSYQEIEKRMGNKGYKVLLVEDNPVNQKVLQKYLKKVGVQVEVAADGVECTDMVLSRGHEYYSLILCDLHMPRKDGYQACREIRQWESENSFGKLPIIALSANVMSDVQDKCVSAGFSDYVTKPVDFIDLSRAMSKFF
ncbi:peroxide stress-activated histidine kinase mak1 [Plectosphaerella plurivora]|uniref:histidine kinase n=1 Tax=Plectosphaerella plurivora TaxID=936078 RepID=A0A9P8V7E6_9PEZI|nr:peroxide stress-activated histidine kinase mak1 [Plectosphaerella plurivora]